MSYEFVLTEVDGAVGVVTIHRPQVRNALNHQTIAELVDALESFDRDDAIRCMVLTGDDRAFAAGADIGQMAEASAIDVLRDDNFARWARFRAIHKPVIAAVSGYALGGGCELALCADIRVAAEDAKLGQPEILLGVIPGAGGTQRLTRLIGSSRAKDIIFTGRFVGAEEALQIGLVDKVVPAAEVYDAAVAWAATFANGPSYALRAAKEAIDRGIEADLDTGLEIERQQFAALFATADRTAGMTSFMEKGPGKATFEGR